MKHAIVGAVFGMTGCTSWQVVAHDDHLIAAPAEYRETLRADVLPGTIEVVGDVIGFQLDVDHACQRIPQGRIEHDTVKKVHLSNLGKLSLGAGVAAMLAAVIGIDQATTDQCVGTTCTPMTREGYAKPLAIVAVTGIALTIAPLLGLPRRNRGVELGSDVDPTPVDVSTLAPIYTSCEGIDPIAAFGELALTTPWGARLTAPIDHDGIARFAVDWAGARIAPAAPAAPADADRIDRWQIESTRAAVHARWRPSLAGRAQIVDLIERHAAS